MGPRELCPFVALLQRYYAGAFARNGKDEWRTLAAFAEEPLARTNEAIDDAIARIACPLDEDVRDFPYAFNRLFVGPDRLQAAPYETVYRSESRTLMRRETLAVRASYRAAGFEPAALNAQPDDHMALELAFLEKLLESEDEGAQAAFQGFLEEHLGQWYRLHAEDVRAHAKNGICAAFADLLEETVEACSTWR